MFISIAVILFGVSGVKEVVMEGAHGAPHVIYGSQVPYILGTREQTLSLMKGLSSGVLGLNDAFYRHIRDEWGDVSSFSHDSFSPLAIGARLVTSHARFMSEHGASLMEVRRYIDDNMRVLSDLGELGIADGTCDFANAVSILHNQKVYSGAERPHAQVSLKEGGELYEVSVHAPDGYHFRSIEAVAVLHEAIGHSAGSLRNEFIFRLHDRHDGRYGLPLAVVQYESRGGERKRVGSLRLRVSDTSIQTRGRSSITVVPSTVAGLASGVLLDDILRVNTSRAA